MPQLDEIVGKENIKQVQDLDKALISLDETFMKVLKSAKETSTVLNTQTDSYTKLKVVQDQTVAQTTKLTDAEKQSEKIAKDQAAAMAALEKQRQAAYATMAKQEAKEKELAAAINMEVKSVDDARKQNEALHKARNKVNLTTEEGKKKAQEYNASIDKNTKFIFENADATTKQKMTIGAYTDSIKSALANMGPFGSKIVNLTNNFQSFGGAMTGANQATKGATTGVQGLGKAIIATGIGAIVIAIVLAFTLLYKIFQSFDPLWEAIERGTAAISAVFKVLQTTVIALVTGATSLRDAFKGLGGRMKEAAIEAAELKREMQKLEELKIQAIVTDAKQKRQIDELLLQSKDRTKSEQERAALIQQALDIEEQQYNARLAIAQKETEIAYGKILEGRMLTEEQKQQLKEQGVAYAFLLQETKSLSDEEIQAYAEALANEETILNESVMIREKAINRQNVLLEKQEEAAKARAEKAEEARQKALEDEMKYLHDVYLANTTTDEEIYQNFVKRLEEKKKAQEDFKTLLENYKEEEESTDFEDHQKKLERIEEEKQAAVKAEEEKLQAKQAALAQAQALGQTLLDFNQFLIDTETAKMEQAKAYELQLAGDNAAKRADIEKKYEKEATKLKQKQAKQDKAQALFSAIIKTAQAVLAGLAFGPPLGYVFAALNAVLGAVQIGVIAAQPIPQFWKGTDSAPDGLISVAEKGQEMIKTRSGKTLLATKPTLLSGMEGARIYSNQDTETLLKYRNAGYDSRELRDTLERNNEKLIKTIRDKREIHITPPRGSRITAREGNFFTNYWTRKIG